jgi:hypothetical protein
LAEAEIEALHRSAVSNRAVTRGDVMPSIEPPNCQNPAGKQDSSEAELRPHSIGRVTTAVAATVLVVMGTLVVTGALLLIVALIPLGVESTRSIDFHVLATQISWDAGTTIAAITIFAGTYLFIGRKKPEMRRLATRIIMPSKRVIVSKSIAR